MCHELSQNGNDTSYSENEFQISQEAPDDFYNLNKRCVHYHLPLILADPDAIIPTYTTSTIDTDDFNSHDHVEIEAEANNFTSSPVTTESF